VGLLGCKIFWFHFADINDVKNRMLGRDWLKLAVEKYFFGFFACESSQRITF
jgi:hypothetical protein